MAEVQDEAARGQIVLREAFAEVTAFEDAAEEGEVLFKEKLKMMKLPEDGRLCSVARTAGSRLRAASAGGRLAIHHDSESRDWTHYIA